MWIPLTLGGGDLLRTLHRISYCSFVNRKVIIAQTEMIYSYPPLYTTERLIGLVVLLQWTEIPRGGLL